MIITIYQIDEYKEVAKQLLSKKRYQHCLNVADECAKLAKRYGEDEQRAYVAGLLHDIKKDESPSSMLSMIIESGVYAEPIELDNSKLWHSIASSVFTEQRFNISDKDILNAIRYHTVARANMSKLELIVYMGDLISVDRFFDDVNYIRELAYKDLEKAVLYSLKFALIELINGEETIPITTIEAYNYYITTTHN